MTKKITILGLSVAAVSLILLGNGLTEPAAQLAYAGQVRTIRCESNGKDYHECRLPGYVEGAHLEKQESHAECKRGRSWGYQDNYVWVDRGCRGKFRVTYSD